MVNKEKAIKRELTRLRKTQNPEQLDFRRMRKLRAAKTSLMKLRRKGTVAPVQKVSEKKKKKEKPKKKPKAKDLELEVIEEEPELEIFDDESEMEGIEEEPELEVIEEKPEKKPKKKEKEPELEVIEDEPEVEEISEDLEDLYTFDEDIDEEDLEEE
ncbi:MAG: hypothetical protein ACFFE1_07610 [Candidatus Thorarchaeota archaeon]